jgi:hypothetical protein
MNIVAAALLRTGFPTEFLLLSGFITVVATLVFIMVLVWAQREHRKRGG